MIKQNPKISVIMPVYNTAKYLIEAIDSILNQTFTDFKFIIIDDCSSDGSLEIIKSYSDKRMIIIENEVNKGYVFGLNYAISIARGKYIARMDSDDISVKTRFSEQFNFLEKNPAIILCGTWFKYIGSNIEICPPSEHADIKIFALEHCPFGHPTVMLKREFIEERALFYRHDFMPAEDYDLWVRILEEGQTANLPKILLLYRVHNSQISSKLSQIQSNKSNLVRVTYLVKYFTTELGVEFRWSTENTRDSILNNYDFLLRCITELENPKLKALAKQEFSDFKRFLFSEAIFQRFTWIIFFVNKLGKIFTFRDIRIIIKYVAKIFLRAIKIYTKN